ncbi:hypothetical protein AAFF_G00257810 [Aldrovandia affinis]|uniref:Uncharacterized protein n=1 Tax=Aldrovandia affinis TaxID=143900 RepID=A0AAD7SUD8_9TELE|nr:hypothetical protein AAFF_G00257810 [Aldrovandia affinis]
MRWPHTAAFRHDKRQGSTSQRPPKGTVMQHVQIHLTASSEPLPAQGSAARREWGEIKPPQQAIHLGGGGVGVGGQQQVFRSSARIRLLIVEGNICTPLEHRRLFV